METRTIGFDIIPKPNKSGYYILHADEPPRFAMTYFKAQHIVKIWKQEIRDAKRM